MAINRNSLAREVTLEEGLKVSVNIGQVKEILRITLKKLAKRRPSEVLALLESITR